MRAQMTEYIVTSENNRIFFHLLVISTIKKKKKNPLITEYIRLQQSPVENNLKIISY